MVWNRIKVGDYIYIKLHRDTYCINPDFESEGYLTHIKREIGLTTIRLGEIEHKIHADNF